MKSGVVRQRIDLVDGNLQGGGHIRVGRLVESNVAIADLDEAEIGAFDGFVAEILGEGLRDWNPAGHSPDESGAGPSHALEKSSTIHAVVVEVL